MKIIINITDNEDLYLCVFITVNNFNFITACCNYLLCNCKKYNKKNQLTKNSKHSCNKL